MKKTMEISAQLDLPDFDYRTERELIESIREKRKRNLPLDKEEAELIRKQAEEEKAERDSIYRR